MTGPYRNPIEVSAAAVRTERIAHAMFEGFDMHERPFNLLHGRPNRVWAQQPPAVQRNWIRKAERFIELWGG